MDQVSFNLDTTTTSRGNIVQGNTRRMTFFHEGEEFCCGGEIAEQLRVCSF